MITNKIGELPRYGTVWVHRDGIANILSLDKVADTPSFDHNYRTPSGNRNFCVETPNGSIKNFVRNGQGLYYYDCEKHFGPGTNGYVSGRNIINTTFDFIEFIDFIDSNPQSPLYTGTFLNYFRTFQKTPGPQFLKIQIRIFFLNYSHHHTSHHHSTRCVCVINCVAQR